MAIIRVKPSGSSGNGTEYTPSSWKYSVQDISKDDSGRDDSGKMWKNKIGEAVKIEIGFRATKAKKTSQILKDFGHEYLDIYYEDDKQGKYIWKTFYAGDRSCTRYTWQEGNKLHESINFNLIERGCT